MFSDHGGIKLEITKEDEKTMYQNIWDEGKMVLRGKFIALNAHVGKEGRSQINHLGFYVKKPEKDPVAPLVGRRTTKQRVIRSVSPVH